MLAGLAAMTAVGLVVLCMQADQLVPIVESLLGIGIFAESSETLHRVDRDQPFKIEFGRGSGMCGLDTVLITSDGHVTLYRQQGRELRKQCLYPIWETTTIQLPKKAVIMVLAAVEKTGVLRLKHRYERTDIADGTQWVFWIQQGSNENSVFCDNDFPGPLVQFSEMLDAILAENGLGDAQWQRISVGDARDHQKALWQSVRHIP